jgi:hypothetical protein
MIRVRMGLGVLLSAALMVAAGCGSDDADTSSNEGPRRPTAAEASDLAGALAGNADAGGAAFTAEVTSSAGAFTMSGEVDWLQQRVAADVIAGSTSYRALTDGAVVDETFPGLPEALTAAGHPGAQWVQRPFDSTAGAFDIVSEIVVGLAAAERDNPVLVRDQARWLREDEIDGVTVAVFEYGDRTEIALGPDGEMVRFQATVERLGGRVVVDLSDPGPHPVAMPDPAVVVPVGLVPDVYRRFTGS